MENIKPLKTIEWLELVRIKTGAKNDSELAIFLEVKRQTISQQKKGQHAQEPLQAAKTAEILEIAPFLVIICSCWERTNNKKSKEKWEKLYLRESGAKFIQCSQTGDMFLDRRKSTKTSQLENQSTII